MHHINVVTKEPRTLTIYFLKIFQINSQTIHLYCLGRYQKYSFTMSFSFQSHFGPIYFIGNRCEQDQNPIGHFYVKQFVQYEYKV